VPGAAALLREASSTGTSARSKRQTRFEERHSSRSDGEAIAMERFDQSEDNGELQPEEDQLFDETSLKE